MQTLATQNQFKPKTHLRSFAPQKWRLIYSLNVLVESKSQSHSCFCRLVLYMCRHSSVQQTKKKKKHDKRWTQIILGCCASSLVFNGIQAGNTQELRCSCLDENIARRRYDDKRFQRRLFELLWYRIRATSSPWDDEGNITAAIGNYWGTKWKWHEGLYIYGFGWERKRVCFWKKPFICWETKWAWNVSRIYNQAVSGFMCGRLVLGKLIGITLQNCKFRFNRFVQ